MSLSSIFNNKFYFLCVWVVLYLSTMKAPATRLPIPPKNSVPFEEPVKAILKSQGYTGYSIVALHWSKINEEKPGWHKIGVTLKYDTTSAVTQVSYFACPFCLQCLDPTDNEQHCNNCHLGFRRFVSTEDNSFAVWMRNTCSSVMCPNLHNICNFYFEAGEDGKHYNHHPPVCCPSLRNTLDLSRPVHDFSFLGRPKDADLDKNSRFATVFIEDLSERKLHTRLQCDDAIYLNLKRQKPLPQVAVIVKKNNKKVIFLYLCPFCSEFLDDNKICSACSLKFQEDHQTLLISEPPPKDTEHGTRNLGVALSLDYPSGKLNFLHTMSPYSYNYPFTAEQFQRMKLMPSDTNNFCLDLNGLCFSSQCPVCRHVFKFQTQYCEHCDAEFLLSLERIRVRNQGQLCAQFSLPKGNCTLLLPDLLPEPLKEIIMTALPVESPKEDTSTSLQSATSPKEDKEPVSHVYEKYEKQPPKCSIRRIHAVCDLLQECGGEWGKSLIKVLVQAAVNSVLVKTADSYRVYHGPVGKLKDVIKLVQTYDPDNYETVNTLLLSAFHGVFI